MDAYNPLEYNIEALAVFPIGYYILSSWDSLKTESLSQLNHVFVFYFFLLEELNLFKESNHFIGLLCSPMLVRLLQNFLYSLHLSKVFLLGGLLYLQQSLIFLFAKVKLAHIFRRTCFFKHSTRVNSRVKTSFRGLHQRHPWVLLVAVLAEQYVLLGKFFL